MKIDFTKIEVPENLAKTRVRVMDIKEAFADVIYRNGQGIACHNLAFKIYNSNADTDYEEREVKLMQALAEQLLTPAVMDGLNDAIDKGKPQQM